MADNVNLTAGDGTIVAGTDTIGGVAYPRAKVVWGPDGTVTDADVASGAALPVQLRSTTGVAVVKNEDVASADADPGIPMLAILKATPADTAGTDGDYQMLQMKNGALWTSPLGFPVTCSTDITRPADTTAYAPNDAWSDSTSAPTVGGFTLSGAARKSGGSGIITDIVVVSSVDPATLLQGELWIFDGAATAVNDNAAFALSDADAKTLVAVVPFTLASTTGGSGTNSYAHLQGLNIQFTAVGSANLRYLVKVKNAYTPASAELLTVRAKILQID
jgi:hypothetical protein